MGAKRGASWDLARASWTLHSSLRSTKGTNNCLTRTTVSLVAVRNCPSTLMLQSMMLEEECMLCFKSYMCHEETHLPSYQDTTNHCN